MDRKRLAATRAHDFARGPTDNVGGGAVAKTLDVRRHVVTNVGRWSKIKTSFEALYSRPVNITHSKCAVYQHEHLDQNLRQSMQFECERGLAALKSYSVEDCLSGLDLVDQAVAQVALQRCMGADVSSAIRGNDLSPFGGISQDLVEQRLSFIKRTQRGISRTLQVLLGVFTGYVAVILYILGTIVSLVTLVQMGIAFLDPTGGAARFLVPTCGAPTSAFTLLSGHILMKASRYLVRGRQQTHANVSTVI